MNDFADDHNAVCIEPDCGHTWPITIKRETCRACANVLGNGDLCSDDCYQHHTERCPSECLCKSGEARGDRCAQCDARLCHECGSRGPGLEDGFCDPGYGCQAHVCPGCGKDGRDEGQPHWEKCLYSRASTST